MAGYIPVLEGKVALTSFCFSVACLLLLSSNAEPLITIIIEAVYILLLVIFHYKYIVKIILISHMIGLLFGVGAYLALYNEQFMFFGVYAMSLSFFHLSEYVTTSIFNAHTLSIDSFLINHSREYGIAAVVSWLEFAVELYFFPDLKSLKIFGIVGSILVIFGEALRKVSMFTAASNFTHVVQYRKKDSHELVTSGVYSLFRHPSYVGWFYWSVGTQVLLCNPVCLVGYALASWMFFNDRIFDEEEQLLQFFKEDYVQYKKKVGTGLPGISGYPLDKVPHLLRLSRTS